MVDLSSVDDPTRCRLGSDGPKIGNQNSAMLADVRQPVQNPQFIRHVCGPKIERLQAFNFWPPRGNLWVGERSIGAAVRGSGGTCGRLTQRIAALPLNRPGRAAARPPAVRRKRDLPRALFSEKGFRSSRE